MGNCEGRKNRRGYALPLLPYAAGRSGFRTYGRIGLVDERPPRNAFDFVLHVGDFLIGQFGLDFSILQFLLQASLTKLGERLFMIPGGFCGLPDVSSVSD